ncbi:MAG: TRAP transporter large permease [Variovorax sp.]
MFWLSFCITGLLVVLLVIGMPIAFAIAVAGTIGIYAIGGVDMVLSFLDTVPLSGAAHYELMTIPMFVLMAQFVIVSGVADELFDTVNAWVHRLKGGLGISTILTGAAFGAICGSSAASAATLSATALPQMVKHGYNRRAASGLTAIVGTLAVMIPPSNGLVIYAILSEVNIGKLLIAGLFPGLLGATTLILTLRFLLWRNPALIQTTEVAADAGRNRVRMLINVAPMLLLFTLVTGLLYLGVATPTEASALGAFGAFVLALVKRRLSWAALKNALWTTARTSTMITMIIIGAMLFGYFLTLTQTTQSIVTYVGALPVDRSVVLTLILLVYLVLGFFLDQVAILVLTVPITLPIITVLGYDPIWFGIIVTLTSEIGLVTPPVGLNVFIVSRYTQTPLQEVFAGVTPYVIAMLGLLALLAAFPRLVMWVPATLSY